jgi:hypothetical protein
MDYLNPSFKDEDSVESGLGLPVLVAIPSVITETDLLASRKFDRKVLIAAAAYLSIFLLVLMREVIQTYLGISIGSY